MRTCSLITAVLVALSLAGGCLFIPADPVADEQQAPDQASPADAAAAKTASVERRDPDEDRRRTYLNVIRLAVDISPDTRMKIAPKKHPATVGKYNAEQEISGAYYETKQGVLLCESGPCSYRWTTKFTYTDEAGRTDAFLLQCSATVFGGMTPSGTGRSKLDWCINGDCEYARDSCHGDAKDHQLTHGRYTLTLSKASLIIRRADISKEVLDAGRKLADY